MTTPDRPRRTNGLRTAEPERAASVPAQRSGPSDPVDTPDTLDAPEAVRTPDTVRTTAAAPPPDGASTRETTTGTRRDRSRWGPIWAGSMVVLTTFIVLQLLFFALGWLDLGFDAGGSAVATAVVSGVLGLVAFFVGGLTAAASTMWRRTSDNVVQGVLVWAVSVAVILLLTLFGGAALLSPLANVFAQPPAGLVPQQVDLDPAQVMATVRQTAGWAALGLGLGAGAAALGGLCGARIWSWRARRGARA